MNAVAPRIDQIGLFMDYMHVRLVGIQFSRHDFKRNI